MKKSLISVCNSAQVSVSSLDGKMLIFRSISPFLPLVLGLFTLAAADEPVDKTKTCTVVAGGNATIDDVPAIYDAIDECGQNGRVVFANTTYYINSVMNTSDLRNCEIDIYGTLLVNPSQL